MATIMKDTIHDRASGSMGNRLGSLLLDKPPIQEPWSAYEDATWQTGSIFATSIIEQLKGIVFVVPGELINCRSILEQHYEIKGNWHRFNEIAGILFEDKVIFEDEVSTSLKIEDFFTLLKWKHKDWVSYKADYDMKPDIGHLKYLYKFINEKEIVFFLHSHDFLIKPLYNTHPVIKDLFNDHLIGTTLEHCTDPEEDFNHLVVGIHTDLPAKESLDLLDKFDEKWWLGIDDEVFEIVIVNLRSE